MSLPIIITYIDKKNNLAWHLKNIYRFNVVTIFFKHLILKQYYAPYNLFNIIVFMSVLNHVVILVSLAMKIMHKTAVIHLKVQTLIKTEYYVGMLFRAFVSVELVV